MKLDRLLGILMVLLQNDRVTAPYLAERFEVSRRTITRDIDALCCAGIPVVTAQGSGGGIWIAEGYKMDRRVFTRDELSDLIASLKGLGSVTQGTQLERTLDKLTVSRQDAMLMPQESIVIDLSLNARESFTRKIALLREAIRDRQVVVFDYYYEKGEMSRQVEPQCVVFQWSTWYLYGYCRTRQDWRLFRLSRLWHLHTPGEMFTPHPLPEAMKSFGIEYADDQPLVALFDPGEKYQLIDSYGMDSFVQMPDGRLRLSVGYTNYAHTLRWILAFGDRVEVITPVEMAEDIRQMARNVLSRPPPGHRA